MHVHRLYDVHDNNNLVEDELKSPPFFKARGISFNIRLLKKQYGREIPLGDATVDFIYSFIVLQHVEKIGIFEINTSRSSSRVLSKIFNLMGSRFYHFGRK